MTALAAGLVTAIGEADRGGLDVPSGIRVAAAEVMVWALRLRQSA